MDFEPEYLDGKYFDAVLNAADNFHSEPVVIEIDPIEEVALIKFPKVYLKPDCLHILRLKIVVKGASTHSNVLIFDTTKDDLNRSKDIIHRFEPLSEKDDLYHLINRLLQTYLHSIFPSFSYRVHNGNQSNDDGCCVAHCIRWILEVLGEKTDRDIHKFVEDLVYTYRNKVNWSKPQDIEYGPWRRGWYGGPHRPQWGGYGDWHGRGIAGLGLGVLGGTLIGGALAGPGGALAGGLLGGAVGYGFGSRIW
jgi:hypothetical protein